MQALCKKCNEIADQGTCHKCGTWNSFRTKESTKGNFFVLGCLLITIGSFSSIVVDHNWLNILDLAFALVYITALWMLVIEARMMGSTMALKALSLFRISAILSMVFLCIYFGIIGFSMLFGFFRGFTFLLLLGLVGGIGYVTIKYYFLALLSVLDGLRIRITENEQEPLEGLDSFLLLSYIGIAISIILAIFNTDGITNMIFILTLTRNLGLLLCLHVLKRFSEV